MTDSKTPEPNSWLDGYLAGHEDGIKEMRLVRNIAIAAAVAFIVALLVQTALSGKAAGADRTDMRLQLAASEALTEPGCRIAGGIVAMARWAAAAHAGQPVRQLVHVGQSGIGQCSDYLGNTVLYSPDGYHKYWFAAFSPSRADHVGTLAFSYVKQAGPEQGMLARAILCGVEPDDVYAVTYDHLQGRVEAAPLGIVCQAVAR